MYNLFITIAYIFVGLNVSIFTWLIAFFGFDLSFWMASMTATGTGIVSFSLLMWRRNLKKRQKSNLSRREYRYIQQQLKEAKQKLRRIQKSFIKLRSLSSISHLIKLERLTNRIYTLVQKEPHRFYDADTFFYYHLDSIVELTERYAFLTRQPVNDLQVKQSLKKTEETLSNMIPSVEKELNTILSKDKEHLAFELDVASKTLERDQQALDMKGEQTNDK